MNYRFTVHFSTSFSTTRTSFRKRGMLSRRHSHPRLRHFPFYPLAFVSDPRSKAFVVPLLLLAALLATLGWLLQRLSDRRLFWFCTVWVLAPLIAPLYLKLFPDFELVHDRYLYLPTIALGVALAAGLKKLSDATPAGTTHER